MRKKNFFLVVNIIVENEKFLMENAISSRLESILNTIPEDAEEDEVEDESDNNEPEEQD